MSTQITPPRNLTHVDRDAFCERIEYVRQKIDLSKTEFAKSLGITKSNYTQVSKGNRLLTVDQLYQLSIIHGVPIAYMIAGSETDLPEKFR